MIGNHFRPWGHLNWALDKIRNKKWDILGCLSTEARCLAAFELTKKKALLGSYTFLQIKDPISIYSNRAEVLMDQSLEDYVAQGGDLTKIENHDLFEKIDKLKTSVDNFIGSSEFTVGHF